MDDDQLREQFARWARPLRDSRPPAVTVLRRRARKRTARQAAVAGAAAVAAVAAVVLSGFGRPGVAPIPAALRGVPPYAVLLEHGGAAAVVLDMVTGATTGQVTPPLSGSGFTWVAAAADDRTFVLADQTPGVAVRFYQLRLTAGGVPGRLTPLNVPELGNSQIYGMALTADASRLAVAWHNDSPAGPATGRLSVTTLATGATSTWSFPGGSAVTVSWAGDQTLAFDWQDARDEARSGLRVLDTAARDTSLLGSRLVLPATGPAGNTVCDPVITADGATVLAVRANADSVALVSYSAATGNRRAVLTPALPSDPQNPAYCGILWADPGGGTLLSQYGNVQARVEDGRYTRIVLPWSIPASPVGDANTFAW